MNTAIILAGGTGSRMGTDTPKQFINVLGRPVMAYTLEIFENNPNIDRIEIVCMEQHLEAVQKIVRACGISKAIWFAPGGNTFQISARNGIYALKGRLSTEDIVLLQFAVSPMVTDEIINDAIYVCRTCGNAVAVDEMVMCTCMKDEDNSRASSRSILRERLVGLNAPQAFRFGDICSAYETAEAMGILDDLEPHTTSLMFALGKTIHFSQSSSMNIKITRREDLDLFEGFLLLKEKRRKEQEMQHDYI